jgi:hypothetical protein
VVDVPGANKEVGSAVDVLEPPSGNSLSLTKVSILANLSSADDTLASDR